jgi:uncharacterized membrane protein YhhN
MLNDRFRFELLLIALYRMKRNHWIILFTVFLVTDIVGLILRNHPVQIASKPLVVLSLIAYFLASTKGVQSDLKKWIVMSLVFSVIGDVFLLFQRSDSIFFILGLSAFMVAHIFYIIFFHSVRVRETIESRWWLLLIIVVYYGGMIYFLSPYLGDMSLPVRIYGIVISFMLMLAMHMTYLPDRKTGLLILLGATLFIISDSILAINKFYAHFRFSGLVIMGTYGIAQLFLTAGAIRYITSNAKR